MPEPDLPRSDQATAGGTGRWAASPERSAGDPRGARPRFALLLQGPVGGFFGALKHGLEDAGWRVLKVNFNAGDAFFARGRGCVAYRRDERGFADWLSRLFRSDPPDAIALFGDQRPLHRLAARIGREWNIPVWSFEEGYLRPGFVTLERGGNNCLSPLPRSRALLPETPPGASMPQPAPARQRFAAMALRAVAYQVAMSAGRAAFPLYRHHRPRPAAAEIQAWGRSLLRKLQRGGRNRIATADILSGRSGGYFLVACQVPDDLQVRRHGRGWTVERLIEDSVASFARFAPAGTMLVVKAHPLARGHLDHEAIMRRAAIGHGCADRVVLIDSGPMAPLARQCRAMVTINSTSGLAALAHGRPVATLGEALYGFDGLAHRIDASSLDLIWSGLELPDAALWARFRAQMLHDSLLPGDFYLKRLWPELVAAAIARLSEARPAFASRTPSAQAIVVPSSSRRPKPRPARVRMPSAVTAGAPPCHPNFPFGPSR